MELGFNEIFRKLQIEKQGDYALRRGRASIAIRSIDKMDGKNMWPFRANLRPLAVPMSRILI
jgi:hypothetical protein